MINFKLVHEIGCGAETFWKVFFDEAFNLKLYREELAFPQFDILDQKETDTQIVRHFKGRPKMNVPGPVARVLGANFGYTQEDVFDKAEKIERWKMVTNVLPDKIRHEGVVRIEVVDDAHVRRISEVTIEVKVFGVGGLIESTAEKQLRDGWETSARFMNRWLAGGAK